MDRSIRERKDLLKERQLIIGNDKDKTRKVIDMSKIQPGMRGYEDRTEAIKRLDADGLMNGTDEFFEAENE